MKPGSFTVNLLDAQQVVHGQLEVVRVHVLVKGGHDGRGVVGVLQTERMAEFVDRYQEQIVTWKQRGEEDETEDSLVCAAALNFSIVSLSLINKQK